MRQRVGFIGLGLMGAPMATNLLAAGFEVTVHNRTPAKAAALASAGARVAGSVAEAASEAEIVVSMLPDSPEVTAVLDGDDGVFAAMPAGGLIVEMSTIAPEVSRTLAATSLARGLQMLDAPVSGGEVGAREGTLSIMVGGEVDPVERARPIFEVLGSKVTHCGPAGSGQIVKACNQIVVAAGIEALAEGVLLCAASGVEPARMLTALDGGLASSRVLDAKGPKLLQRDFEPGFRSELHLKDLRIALAAGTEAKLALPAADLLSSLFEDLVARDRGGLDHSALLLALEDLSSRPG